MMHTKDLQKRKSYGKALTNNAAQFNQSSDIHSSESQIPVHHQYESNEPMIEETKVRNISSANVTEELSQKQVNNMQGDSKL